MRGAQEDRGLIIVSSLLDFLFFFPRWVCFSETRRLFQSFSVGAAWDGCHHVARKTCGTAAVPTSENGQTEGKKERKKVEIFLRINGLRAKID